MARHQVYFSQFDLRVSCHYPVFSGMSVSCSLAGGHCWGSRPLLHNMPNFFNPMILRGFSPPTGWTGDLTNASVGLSVNSKLPYLGQTSFISRHVRFHLFLAGHSSSAGGGVTSVLRPPANVVAGVGLVARLHDLARLELNYSVPTHFGK